MPQIENKSQVALTRENNQLLLPTPGKTSITTKHAYYSCNQSSCLSTLKWKEQSVLLTF